MPQFYTWYACRQHRAFASKHRDMILTRKYARHEETDDFTTWNEYYIRVLN